MSIISLLNVGMVFVEYCYDFYRTILWSKASPFCPKEKRLYYDIVLLAHTVEKGLSVKTPRPKFGKAKIMSMLSMLDEYSFGWPLFPVEKSYGCLNAYLAWHIDRNIELDSEIKSKIQSYLDRCKRENITRKGGVKVISGSAHFDSAKDLLGGRYSSRQFLPEVVSNEKLELIASLVRRTPSQCNRQSARIHFYSDKNQIDELLRLQGGAEGFREDVYNLFVISSEISAWSGYKARSQAYVDGSLMAMQVLNACHIAKLGCCPLNLAVSNKKELKIIKVGDISGGERLIMMIAFGNIEEREFLAATSERISNETLMVRHS